MSRIAPMTLIAAASAMAITGNGPASAQCRLCADPTTRAQSEAPAEQLRLDVETVLTFDRLVLFGLGEGSAEIQPDGSRRAGGAISQVGPRAMAGTAVIHGTPGRAVRIDLPSRIELHSLSGGTISFDEVTSDLPALPRLDGAGRLSFRFGGRIRVRGDADGDYRGDLPITVEYQ